MFQIIVIRDERKESNVIQYEPSCVSINQENGDVAIGAITDNMVCLLNSYLKIIVRI